MHYPQSFANNVLQVHASPHVPLQYISHHIVFTASQMASAKRCPWWKMTRNNNNNNNSSKWLRFQLNPNTPAV